MSRKSLSISEDLAQRYRMPTGNGYVFDRLASIRPPSKAELAELQARVTVTDRCLFGASRFTTKDGSVIAEDVRPQIGGTGWKRYPGCDHWKISRSDGSVIFRTQNYAAMLRYFMRLTARAAIARARSARPTP